MESKEISNEELIESIPKLKFYIRTFIRDENSVDDILQETLISALSKLIELEEPYNIFGWLRTVARNKCLNFLKSQKKMIRFNNIPERYFSMELDSAENENEDRLVSSLNNLPDSQKYIVKMKYFTHHSIKEISKLFKIPEGTVKRRLFDARKNLKKDMEMKKEKGKKTKRIAPEIKIVPKKESKIKSVKRLGYGLCFGAPLAGIGDVEVCDAYEYPGRIFVYRANSKVNRKAMMLGSEVWEVVNEYEKREGEHSRFLYYTFDEKEISMPFRIMNFSPELRIDIDQKELVGPSELEIRTGEFVEPEKDNEIRVIDVVDVKIGDKEYKDVIRKKYSSDDYHGRCYTEEFYNSEGREILQRNYIGENWKMGGFVTWEKWKDSLEIEFKGENFRLWFEFILIDRYTEK